METLLSERVFSKKKKLLNPLPRNKRLNFEKITVLKQTSKSLNHAAVEFAEGVGTLSLEEMSACQCIMQMVPKENQQRANH